MDTLKFRILVILIQIWIMNILHFFFIINTKLNFFFNFDKGFTIESSQESMELHKDLKGLPAFFKNKREGDLRCWPFKPYQYFNFSYFNII